MGQHAPDGGPVAREATGYECHVGRAGSEGMGRIDDGIALGVGGMVSPELQRQAPAFQHCLLEGREVGGVSCTRRRPPDLQLACRARPRVGLVSKHGLGPLPHPLRQRSTPLQKARQRLGYDGRLHLGECLEEECLEARHAAIRLA
jgi:hypothetical protein